MLMVYDYYDVEQIEEFIAVKGACEIESLFRKNDAFDDVSRPENLTILKYYYLNYEYNSHIDGFIEKVSLSKKRLIFCRSLWKKKSMTL